MVLLVPLFVFLFSMILHYVGLFDALELRFYDHLMQKRRGPLTGWMAQDSTYVSRGTDVVLVEVDDEAWRLVPESWPYSRGGIWSSVLENLAKAGARVVLFDILFDTPERQSEYLRYFVTHSGDSTLKNALPVHGDSLFAQTIKRVQKMGCNVVLSSKIAKDASLSPPQYLVTPIDAIMSGGPELGLVNAYADADGTIRQYPIGAIMEHEPEKIYLSLGMKALKFYRDIADSVVPVYHAKEGEWSYGPFRIPQLPLADRHTFLINYYGPPSHYHFLELPPWETFPVFSLSKILDTKEVTLRNPMEDVDWMEHYISDELPDWILAIEDSVQRQRVITSMGMDKKSAPEQSPFYNKIVIIGVSVEVIHDLMISPFYMYQGVSQYMPGLEVHANAIQTILDSNYITSVGGTITAVYEHELPLSHLLIILFFTAVPFALIRKRNPLLALAFLLLVALLYLALVYGLFMGDPLYIIKTVLQRVPLTFIAHAKVLQTTLPLPGESTIVPITIPLFAMILTYFADLVFALLVEHQKKVFLRESFGAYVSPKLIEDMYETNHKPELGGVERKGTAFFSDIVSFSSLSELVTPSELITIMNDYFTEMTSILLEEGGTLDKYIGDAIIAFWGAPIPVEFQEVEACKTALRMEQALTLLREKWKEQNYPQRVYKMHHRIGLHTGRIVTGNVGSSTRMNYTMMGDDVNTGARLESSAKQYGIYVHVSESVYKAARDEFEFRFIDYVRVKGKTHPIRTYELLGERDSLSDEQRRFLEAYKNGIEAYRAREWKRALAYFYRASRSEMSLQEITPSKVYISRCQHFIEAPPLPGWDGVWTLTQK